MNSKFILRSVLALVLTLGLVAPAVAQNVGNVYIVCRDNDGAALPGVSVTISGIGAPRLQVSNAEGQVRFLGLDPGSYSLTAELDGFSTVEYPNVVVTLNRNTSLEVTLSPAVEETITVTSESPLLDERKLQAGTNISRQELEKIPTARDPWAVLNQTPGVLVDRINVGGNESGQQSVFRGPGVSDDENAFLVDGVEITDMAAIGASPTYYDFDQFEAFEMSTGGSDVTRSNAGVSVNMVTKRGTNEFRGSARFNVTEDSMIGGFFEQSTKEVAASDLGINQTSGFQSNSINKIEEFGFEAGGPVLQDKLWAWGSYGENDVMQFNAGGGADNTILRNTSVKGNAQITGSNSAVGSWNVGDKNKFGRGAGPSRSAETTWDQRGPTDIYKFEDTHVFSSDFYLTGQYSKVDGGFSLTTKAGAGPSAPETLWDVDGVWRNNFQSGFSQRPSEEWRADGSYFFNTASVSHELKFGARTRDFETSSSFHWPGRDIVHIAGSNFGTGGDYFFLYRVGNYASGQTYDSAWIQDTLTTGNFTVNVGLRYDKQTGTNFADSVADSAIPSVLPGLNYGGAGAGFSWEDVTPRLGLTYALGESRDTLLRASYARFAEQLSTANTTYLNPLSAAYAYFYFVDQNGDHMWQANEQYQFLFGSGFDPSNPGSLSSPNQVDSGLSAPLTDELILGIEHAFLPEFVAGLNVTWRNTTDLIDSRNLVTDGTTVRTELASDYLVDTSVNGSFYGGGITCTAGQCSGTLPDGSTGSTTFYTLNPALGFQGGLAYTNGGRSVDYQGLGITFTKRLSNRWMARGYFNYGSSDYSVPSSYLATTDPNDFTDGRDNDGARYFVQSTGSGRGDIYLDSTWQWNLTGMYQIAPSAPYGFNVSANIYSREGYPVPYDLRITGADGVTRNDSLLASDVDRVRTDNPLTVDLRLEKEFAATSNVNFTIGLDAFNVLNERTVLAREPTLTGGTADNIQDVISARVYRLGARISWR